MNKIIIALGILAISVSAVTVDCPEEDENSTATYFPHEIECGKFYECHNGSPEILECPPGTYWDTRLNVCDREANCGDLSTSTEPPQTTETTPTTEPSTEVPTEPTSEESFKLDFEEEEK